MDQCLTSFTIYETTTRYYIVGGTQDEAHFSVIKIDRTVPERELCLEEDETMYKKCEMDALIAALDAGNSATGGMHKLATSCGIIGLIRFTANHYLSIITRRTAIALLGGHYIYHIDDTKLIPLTAVSSFRRNERYADEARYLSIMNNLEIGKTFYFSTTYDITHSLQYNLTTKKSEKDEFLGNYNEMFVWNHYLLQNAFARLKGHSKWCVPIIHGFIDQAKLSIYGKPVFITLIARRSRYFAGARFLKRGANERGYVANDVESEQIISEQLTTSFFSASGEVSDRYTSFVQHRGSIPLNWTQVADGVNPKPPIELNVVDPFFRAAALHFDDMLRRYGSPLVVINLIKARERTPREMILLHEFTEAINYLNQFLPKEQLIRYIAWDMSRASKSREQEVISTLERLAEDAIDATGFFQSGQNSKHRQSGVARTNCIDCLDRTNAAQFVIAKHALAVQLCSLSLAMSPDEVRYDCDAVSMMIEMWKDHGDTIALQYGGSHLVNTMETYRKINQWHSHSRDMIESIRRFYNNSFVDAQRQDAINLFLGNFRVDDAAGSLNLWDMENDYNLHYDNDIMTYPRRDYQQWWTPEYIAEPQIELPRRTTSNEDRCYWQEYYRTNVLSSLSKVFANTMNSTTKYNPRHDDFDPSPFVVRTQSMQAAQKEESFKLGKSPNHKSKLSLHRWLGHASYEKATANQPRKAKPQSTPEKSKKSTINNVKPEAVKSDLEVLVESLIDTSIDNAAEYERLTDTSSHTSVLEYSHLGNLPGLIARGPSNADLELYRNAAQNVKVS